MLIRYIVSPIRTSDTYIIWIMFFCPCCYTIYQSSASIEWLYLTFSHDTLLTIFQIVHCLIFKGIDFFHYCNSTKINLQRLGTCFGSSSKLNTWLHYMAIYFVSYISVVSVHLSICQSQAVNSQCHVGLADHVSWCFGPNILMSLLWQ